MDFEKTSLTVSRGYSYSYIHIPPSTSSKPYILFLHGFPSLPTDFHSQISHLSSLGYGIIAPELLGYGDTSHPTDHDAYRLKLMSSDLIKILDHHSIRSVLAVGHDWGVTLLTRLEFYYPERIAKMALLTISCSPFGQPFDLDAVNSMTKEHLGYEGYGYIAFFTRDPDAATILNDHADSFRSLMFHPKAEMWKQYFGSNGGLKKWLTEIRIETTMDSYTDSLRKEHEKAFAVKKGGYTATLNWYRSHVLNLNIPDEEAELQKKGLTNYQIEKPVLQILAAKDPIALAPVQQQMTEAYAPHARIEALEAGHWVMLEAPKAINQALEDFFAKED